MGRTLTLKVKYSDFTQITRSLTHTSPLLTKDDILPLAKNLLKKVDYSATHPIRLLGLGVSGNEDEIKHEQKGMWIEQELPFREHF